MRNTGDDVMGTRDGSGDDRSSGPEAWPAGAVAEPGAWARAAPDFGNVRFLIEQQLQVVDDLDRRGLDGRAAYDLLRRLMRQDEEIRRRLAARNPLRVA